jgi:hypothetical protein
MGLELLKIYLKGIWYLEFGMEAWISSQEAWWVAKLCFKRADGMKMTHRLQDILFPEDGHAPHSSCSLEGSVSSSFLGLYTACMWRRWQRKFCVRIALNPLGESAVPAAASVTSKVFNMGSKKMNKLTKEQFFNVSWCLCILDSPQLITTWFDFICC